MAHSETPPRPITFQLTPDERNLIVRKSLALDGSLVARLRLGIADGKRLTYELAEEDFNDLLDALASDANHAADRRIRRRFSRLYDRLSRAPREQTAQTAMPQWQSGALPSELRTDMQRLLASRDFTNLDEANAELRKLTDAHNRRPRPEFDGLSPRQVSRLIYSDWESPTSAISFNRELPLSEVKEATFLRNARVFLGALQQSGKTKATSAGNLNRKFILQMLEAMAWPPHFLEDLWRYNKVVNEEDVFPLHLNRLVAQLAGLIRKTKGAFHLTKKGRDLCQEDRADELFAALFQTFFRKFNLGYLDRVPECQSIQQTIGYSLCVLDRRAGTWQAIEDLAPRLYLPTVTHELPVDRHGLDYETLLARTRILGPLESFGLIQCRYSRKEPMIRPKISHARKTALFNRFLRFDLD
jgi:hypothetical protein